jgi:hypothetical protein
MTYSRRGAQDDCAHFPELGLAVAAVVLSILRALVATWIKATSLAAALIFLTIAPVSCEAQGTGASIDETAITRSVYVDPSLGNDSSNSGIQSSPFKTINRALSVAARNLSGGMRAAT